MRSRYNSGAAPGIVRLNPDGMIEAGSDPFYYRAARAW
jgi:gamma-glutamyltranspeptidase/glutathione hydrolase